MGSRTVAPQPPHDLPRSGMIRILGGTFRMVADQHMTRTLMGGDEVCPTGMRREQSLQLRGATSLQGASAITSSDNSDQTRTPRNKVPARKTGRANGQPFQSVFIRR